MPCTIMSYSVANNYCALSGFQTAGPFSGFKRLRTQNQKGRSNKYSKYLQEIISAKQVLMKKLQTTFLVGNVGHLQTLNIVVYLQEITTYYMCQVNFICSQLRLFPHLKPVITRTIIQKTIKGFIAVIILFCSSRDRF